MNVHVKPARVALLLALPALALSALGQVVVAPSPFTSTEGNPNGGFSPFGSGFGGTTQILIEQSALNLSVGDTINGIAFRIDGGAVGGPATPANFTSFNVSIGQATTTAETMSATFTDNISSPTLVRSGALTISPNAFPGGSTPNSFGQVINFTTPFVYNGGNLVFEIRSSGSTGGSFNNVDADQNPASGYGTTYNATFGFLSSATTGNPNAAPIMQLSITPVPEPASVALVSGLSLAGFAVVRRLRR